MHETPTTVCGTLVLHGLLHTATYYYVVLLTTMHYTALLHITNTTIHTTPYYKLLPPTMYYVLGHTSTFYTPVICIQRNLPMQNTKETYVDSAQPCNAKGNKTTQIQYRLANALQCKTQQDYVDSAEPSNAKRNKTIL